MITVLFQIYEVHNLIARWKEVRTYVVLPFLPDIRRAADVLRLMFFFPSGVSVERHVKQGFLLGGAVKQSR